MSILRTNQITNTAGDASPSFPNGLAGISGVGKALQVVHQNQVTRYSTSGSSYVALFNATITPSLTSSKIMVRVDGTAYNPSGYAVLTIFRGDTSGTDLGSGASYGMMQVTAGLTTIGTTIVDSPNTTSAVIYTVALKAMNGGTASFGENTTYSHITLTEIGA